MSALTLTRCGLLGLVAVTAYGSEEGKARSRTLLSPIYEVSGEYRSMEGPQSTQQVLLVESNELELLWIRGYRASMVGGDGRQPVSQEFMCHTNLDFDPHLHNQLLGLSKPISSRLFTLSQGQLEIRFPSGFGLPLFSAEPLSLTTQVLNLNGDRQLDVRHRVTLDYVLDRELNAPLQPLFVRGIYGLVDLEGDHPYFDLERGDAEAHGPGCLAGENASTHEFLDPAGRRFTGHWVVKPGREENHTRVTPILDLPFDTTVHYIAVHLHPFAESLELVDLTTGESVFRSRTRQFDDRIGLAHVDAFISEEGLPLHRDHEYGLVSVYNNTTDEDQDSMAVMNLYLLDKEFSYPVATPSIGSLDRAVSD